MLTYEFCVNRKVSSDVVRVLELLVDHELESSVRDAPQTGNETLIKRKR